MFDWYFPLFMIDWGLRIELLAWLLCLAAAYWIAWRTLIKKRPWLQRDKDRSKTNSHES